MNPSRKPWQKGGMVVEAAIVVPVVVLSLIAVIYMALILYQRAYLQSLADKTAKQAALMWNDSAKDFETGRPGPPDADGDGLYWRIFDRKKEDKVRKILEYADENSESRSLFKGRGIRTYVEVVDYAVYKKLVVTVEDSYQIPIGKLLSIFGMGDSLSIKVTSEAVLNEPAEFIRNTDFIFDIERELEHKNPGIGNLAEKTRNVMNKIKDWLIDFFK